MQQDTDSAACVDLTGLFPKKFSQDNEHILVAYHYDSNYIHSHPLKDRKRHTIAKGWKQIHTMIQKAGTPLETHVLDNEISQDLKTRLIKKTSFTS